jgi:hypothetical protein
MTLLAWFLGIVTGTVAGALVGWRAKRAQGHAPVLDDLIDWDEPMCAACGEHIDFDGSRWFHGREALDRESIEVLGV